VKFRRIATYPDERRDRGYDHPIHSNTAVSKGRPSNKDKVADRYDVLWNAVEDHLLLGEAVVCQQAREI